MKNEKGMRSRLFAALTAAGGSLVLSTLFLVWGIPNFQLWQLALSLDTAGFLLMLAGFYVRFHELK